MTNMRIHLSLLGILAGFLPVIGSEWTTNDYRSALADADAKRVPLIAYYGRAGCGACQMMKRAFLSETFKSWFTEKSYVFVDGSGDQYAHAALLQQGGFIPYFRVYWHKRSGEIVDAKFSGRNGHLPGTTSANPLKNDALASALIAVVDGYVGDYVPFQYEASSFDTDLNNPLEVEQGLTTNLIIGINRPALMADEVTTNLVVIGAVTNTVIWSIGETRREFLMDDFSLYHTGDRISLQLFDPFRPADGVQSESFIVFVAPQANSVMNPHALDEAFAFGEWTLDYEAARAAVQARAGSKLVLLFSGVLWCPYCKGMENSLLSSQEFRDWARTNNVALVLMDQGRASTPATAEGLSAPRLVSYELDPKGTGVSGASYVSRHMISADLAKAYMSQVTRLTQVCLSPESTAVRCGNPTLVLFDAEQERPIARLNAWRDDNKFYDPTENVARLSDLMSLTIYSEGNAYPTTTSLTLSVTGQVESARLQINDAVRVYRVTDIVRHSLVSFNVQQDSINQDVVLTMYATDSTALESEILASGINAVSCAFKKVATNVFLRVESFVEKKKYGPDTGFDLVITAKETIDPEPEDTEFGVYAGIAIDRMIAVDGIEQLNAIKLRVVSGKLPTGLKLSFDRDTKQVKVSGTPKKEIQATVVFSITGKNSSGDTVEQYVTLEFDIKDPLLINSYAGKAQTQFLPVYGNGELIATMEVKTTSRNKLSIKINGVDKKRYSFTGNWQGVDEDGVLYADLIARDKSRLSLQLDPNGLWYAEFSAINTDDDVFAVNGIRGITASELSHYIGNYTVTLPVNGMGTGYLVFSVKRSSRISVSGMLADGTVIKCNTYLVSNALGQTVLPILIVASKNVLSAELVIAADGQLNQSDAPMTIVGSSNDAYWSHSERGYSFKVPVLVYGTWYDPSVNLEAYCLGAYDLDNTPVVMKASLDMEGLSVGSMGTPDTLETVNVVVNETTLKVDDVKNWLSLKFVKNTGVISGTVLLRFSSVNKIVKAKFKGVVLPGWYDCGCGEGIIDRPFASAAVYFKDKINGGKIVTLSCGLNLKAETQIMEK